jgi:hypothetical protein
LAVPLLIEWFMQHRRQGESTNRRNAIGLVAVVAAPLAFGAFLAVIAWRYGTPLAFFRAQDALGYGTLRHPIGLLTVADWKAIIDNTAPAIRGYSPTHSAFKTVLITAVVDASALLVAGLAGVWLLLRARWVDGIFVLFGTIAAFAIWGLPDSPRHLLALVPIYLVLARWANRPLVGYIAALVGLETLALAYFLYLNVL